MAQTFRVTATPRTRFVISVLLFHKDLKFKDRIKERSLYRVRKALGLLEPSQQFSTHNRVGNIWKDHSTRNVFEVTIDQAEFLIDNLSKIEKSTNDLLYVEDLLEQLEAKEDAADVEEGVSFDEKAEAPGWVPSLEPLLTNPALFYDVMREACSMGNFGGFSKIMLGALRVEEESEGDVVPISQAG